MCVCTARRGGVAGAGLRLALNGCRHPRTCAHGCPHLIIDVNCAIIDVLSLMCTSGGTQPRLFPLQLLQQSALDHPSMLLPGLPSPSPDPTPSVGRAPAGPQRPHSTMPTVHAQPACACVGAHGACIDLHRATTCLHELRPVCKVCGSGVHAKRLPLRFRLHYPWAYTS